MTVVQLKLKRLKAELKNWNHYVFGNIQTQVEQAKSKLVEAQLNIDILGHSSSRDKEEEMAQLEFQSALSRQERF